METSISRLEGIEKKRLFLMELRSGISIFNSPIFFPQEIAIFTEVQPKQETLRNGILKYRLLFKFPGIWGYPNTLLNSHTLCSE